MEFEKCLRAGRRKLHLSQRDLAEKVGLSTESIVKLESGWFAEVSEEQLLKIAQIIDMDEHIFTQMYRVEFMSELKTQPATSHQTIETITESSLAAPAIEPDLLEIANSIMALPAELQNNLLQIVKVLAIKEASA